MEIGVSLLVTEHSYDLIKCVRSFHDIYGDRDLLKIALIQSQDEKAKTLLEENGWQVLTENENIGVPKGRNKTYKKLMEDPSLKYIVQIHEDMFFFEDFIFPMANYMDAHPETGIIGASGIIGDRVRTYELGRMKAIADKLRGNAVWIGNIQPNVFRIDALKKVGLFDENFGKQDCEDCDLNKRFTDAGYLCLGTTACWVLHVMMGVRKSLPDAEKESQKSREHWRKKWHGEKIDEYNRLKLGWKKIDEYELIINTI